MKGKSETSNQQYQFTFTLFLIILMMSYLLTLFLTDTTTIRTFGKKHSFQINKYRQLRFTREVTGEGGSNELFPIVDDNIDLRGTKTNIASPILDKSKRKKKVTVSQVDAFAEENNHDIFIDEFLDNMLDDLGTTSGNEAPVEESSEEEFIDVDSSSNEGEQDNVSTKFPDYDLIEMFLDLILMVKIDETLSSRTTSNNIPHVISNSPIPSSSTITTRIASQTRVVKLSKESTTNVIITTSTVKPGLVQLLQTTPKMTISQQSTITTTKFKIDASHVESTTPLSNRTNSTEISLLPIRKDPLVGNVTEGRSTTPQILINESVVSIPAITATVLTTVNGKILTQSSTVNATVAYPLNASVDSSVTMPSTIRAVSTPRSIIVSLSSLRQQQLNGSDVKQKVNPEPVYTAERKVSNRQRLQNYDKTGTMLADSMTQSTTVVDSSTFKLRLVKLLTTPTTIISRHSTASTTKFMDTFNSIHTESTSPASSVSVGAIVTTVDEKTPLLLAAQHIKAVPLTSMTVETSTLIPSTLRFTTTATPSANGIVTRRLPTTITRERNKPPRKMENQEPLNNPGRKVNGHVFKNRYKTKIAESKSRPTALKGISVRQRFKNYYETKKTKSTPKPPSTTGSILVQSLTTVFVTASTYSSVVAESKSSPSVKLSALRENESTVLSTAPVEDPVVVTVRPESHENISHLSENKKDDIEINYKTAPSSTFQTRVVKVVKEGTVNVITTTSTFHPRVVKLLTTTKAPENSIVSGDNTSTSGLTNITVLPLLETVRNFGSSIQPMSQESSAPSVSTAVFQLNSSSMFPFFEAVPNIPVSTTTAFPFSTFPAVPNDSFEEPNVQRVFKMENDVKIEAKELLKKYMNSSKNRPVDIFDQTLDLMEALTSEHAKDVGSEKGLKKLRNRTRVPHFKHKKFSQYYRNLKLNKKSLDLPETVQKTILSSLREQLTASVLGNKKLRKKANHEPVFNPRRKINSGRFKNYYKTKIAKMVMKDVSLLPDEVQTQLKNELEASLTENLEEVLYEIAKKEDAKKKQEDAELAKEEDARKKQEEALKSSLKYQLLKVLGN